MAVFRGQDGEDYVVDAYCPHLGANLAVGGRVVGNCIECPFHGWQFRGNDGKCVKIPYAEKGMNGRWCPVIFILQNVLWGTKNTCNLTTPQCHSVVIVCIIEGLVNSLI